MKKLILSSSSKPREALLRRLKIPFEIISPDVDETPLPHEPPEQLVQRLAEKKARVIGEKFPDALIIGADQVGTLHEQILCKPLTHENAVKQLQQVSGQRVRFFIGLCLFDSHNQTQQLALETFDVIFRKLSLTVIESYLQKEDVLNCAGSFKVEGLGIALAEELQGQDYTALIGLPLIRLTKMLEDMGMEILSLNNLDMAKK